MDVHLRDAARSADHDPAPGSSTYGSAIPIVEADGHLRPLAAIEADIIRMAIRHYGGHMSEVARRLQIGRSTLYRKLGELGIDKRS